MKLKCFCFIFAFVFLTPVFSYAQNLCTFNGFWDLESKEVSLAIKFPEGGEVGFYSKEKDPAFVDFRLDFRGLSFLFFDVTTQISGKARIIDVPNDYPVIKGTLNDGGVALKVSDHPLHFVVGNFELKEDKIFFSDCFWAGLELKGTCSLFSPYSVDLLVDAHEVLLSDLLLWFGQEENHSQGDVSGELHLSGSLDNFFIKGHLGSSGQIGDFHYDSIVANFEGAYPVVKLNDTSVTQSDGTSFFLEGNIDLAKDFAKFSEQLSKMKMLPLIRQTDVDRQWTIRKATEDKKEGETEFKYRLKRDREVSGLEEGGMLSIERSIKF